MQYVRFLDTTLRDGEQSPGVALNTAQKLEIGHALARLGVDVIEAGFPITSQGDFECVQAIATEVQGPIICALARTHELDIDRAAKAVAPSARPMIHIFTSASDIHLEYMLRKTRDEVLEISDRMVRYARQYADEVEFSAQDCMRADPAFVYQLVRAAIAAGANTVNIPDTTGYGTPVEYGALIENIFLNVPEAADIRISTHCHDDLGMAVANSLAAVENGATQVEATINGIGERAGNTALEEVAMALYTRKDHYGVETGINTREISRISRLVVRHTGMMVQANKAVVGENAFSHEAGIHQDGVIKHRATYEIMNAELVGRDAGVLVMGKHSGRRAFRKTLADLGYEAIDDERLNAVFTQFKDLCDRKSLITNEDIRALVDNETGRVPETYTLHFVQFQSGTKMTPVATVCLETDTGIYTQAATGDGPVDAAYKALEAITGLPLDLDSYELRGVGSGKDALGEVTIRVRNEARLIQGRGLSTDVVEASARAYVDVLNKLVAGQVRDHDSHAARLAGAATRP